MNSYHVTIYFSICRDSVGKALSSGPRAWVQGSLGKTPLCMLMTLKLDSDHEEASYYTEKMTNGV